MNCKPGYSKFSEQQTSYRKLYCVMKSCDKTVPSSCNPTLELLHLQTIHIKILKISNLSNAS